MEHATILIPLLSQAHPLHHGLPHAEEGRGRSWHGYAQMQLGYAQNHCLTHTHVLHHHICHLSELLWPRHRLAPPFQCHLALVTVGSPYAHLHFLLVKYYRDLS